MNERRLDDLHLCPCVPVYLCTCVCACLLQQRPVCVQRGVNRAGIQPGADRFRACPRALLDHDRDGIREEEFVLERHAARHLFVNRGQQGLGAFEVITSHHYQVVFQRLGFFDEARHPAVRSHLGHAEAARVRDGHHPGNAIRPLVREKREVGVHQCIGKAHHHRSMQIFPR